MPQVKIAASHVWDKEGKINVKHKYFSFFFYPRNRHSQPEFGKTLPGKSIPLTLDNDEKEWENILKD